MYSCIKPVEKLCTEVSTYQYTAEFHRWYLSADQSSDALLDRNQSHADGLHTVLVGCNVDNFE